MPLPLGPSLSGLLLDAVLATSTRSYEERRKDENTTSPPSWSLWGTMPWASAAASAPTTCYDIGCCLSQVLGSLSPRDLARAQVSISAVGYFQQEYDDTLHPATCLPAPARPQMVCRQWRDVACLPEVRHACFARKWGLAAVHAPEGSHRAWAFLQSINSISCFVRKHMLQPGDTVQSVAVMHGMDVPSIKRLNNMISDSSVTCRTYLYVPGTSRQLLYRDTCRINVWRNPCTAQLRRPSCQWQMPGCPAHQRRFKDLSCSFPLCLT